MKTKFSNFGEFFRRLRPKLDMREVTLELSHGYEVLDQTVLTMYELDLAVRLDSPTMNQLSAVMGRVLSRAEGKYPYPTVAKAARTISEQADDVHELMEAAFNRKVVKDVIDYRGLNLLRYAEGLEFFNNYAIALAQVVAHESHEAADLPVSPVDRRNVDFVRSATNMETFVRVLEILRRPVKEFARAIKDLEGQVFDIDSYDVVKTTTGRKTDPVGVGFLPLGLNPFYYAGLKLNERRLLRQQKHKEEVAKYQLTLLRIKKTREGTSNPEDLERLDKQIKNYSNLINRIQAKIEPLEEVA